MGGRTSSLVITPATLPGEFYEFSNGPYRSSAPGARSSEGRTIQYQPRVTPSGRGSPSNSTRGPPRGADAPGSGAAEAPRAEASAAPVAGGRSPGAALTGACPRCGTARTRRSGGASGLRHAGGHRGYPGRETARGGALTPTGESAADGETAPGRGHGRALYLVRPRHPHGRALLHPPRRLGRRPRPDRR